MNQWTPQTELQTYRTYCGSTLSKLTGRLAEQGFRLQFDPVEKGDPTVMAYCLFFKGLPEEYGLQPELLRNRICRELEGIMLGPLQCFHQPAIAAEPDSEAAIGMVLNQCRMPIRFQLEIAAERLEGCRVRMVKDAVSKPAQYVWAEK